MRLRLTFSFLFGPSILMAVTYSTWKLRAARAIVSHKADDLRVVFSVLIFFA